MAVREIECGGARWKFSYEIVNPSKKRTIVWLHGWGANKGLMKQAFGKTLGGYRHLYVDLPGFGGSSAPHPYDSAEAAETVACLLRELGAAEIAAVVGHSFGGKVATLLDPPLLVLLASAGIVRPKPLKIRMKIALFKTLRKLGLSKLRTLFVAADAKGLDPIMYDTFKQVVDEDFSQRFAAFGGRALLCWGREDTATPLAGGEKIASLIRHSRLAVFDGDHYFFLKRPETVAREIETELEESA